MEMTHIRAYGDSFTRYTGSMSDFWPAKLGVRLNKPVENLGYSSISNFSIALHALRDWYAHSIDSKTLILFMMTDCTRMPVIDESCHGFTSDHSFLSDSYKYAQPFRQWYRTQEWCNNFRIQEEYTLHAFRIMEGIVRATECTLRYLIGWSDIDERFPRITEYLRSSPNTYIHRNPDCTKWYSLSTELVGINQSQERTNPEFFIPNDGHWTSEMHTLVAERIGEYILKDRR